MPKQLWELAGGLKRWPNYLSVGQGMGDTLRIADEKRGYTLSDTGTYRNLGEELQLEIVVAGGTGLRNPYAAIVVNPSKSTLIDSNLANQFVDFLIADATQRRIADYTANGEPFFTPTRLLK